MRSKGPFCTAIVAVALLLGGCAGHSKKTLEARQALDAGQPKRAMTLYNKVLGVKSNEELPEKEKKDTAILVLDRSMISQQLDEFEESSQDLEYADKAIEILDMSRTAAADIGKYVFSDDTGPYKAPPYEKVMINTMNMVNYLVRHDLSGARVEARRFSIMKKYLTDSGNPAEEMTAPGAYLAGFTFEQSGELDSALRYYDEALQYGEFEHLAGPVARIHGPGSYSTPRLREFLQKHGYGATPQTSPPTATARATQPDPNEPGELLIVVGYGRVPAKVAKRIPIGLALTYATANLTGPKRNTANRLAAQGLVTWVNYPELEEKTRRVSPPSLQINGRSYPLETAADLAAATRKAYEEDRGAIIAAAITRMISRVVAGESLGAAARGASNDNILAALVSLGTQAALTAADTPDTRSWVTLPARIGIARLRLKPGRHRIRLSAQGRTKVVEVTMQPGGWETVAMTVLR